MAKKYNHSSKIIQRSKGTIGIKELKPGSLVEFLYTSETSKTKPLVLVLTNGYYDKKANSKENILVHGINFNYLKDVYIKKMKEAIEKKLILGNQIQFTKEVRDERGRYMIEKNRYTRLTLPTKQYSATGTSELGGAQLRVLIKTLYAKVIEKIAEKHDCYRTYIAYDMHSIRGILYKF